jgi:hypothetical protein
MPLSGQQKGKGLKVEELTGRGSDLVPRFNRQKLNGPLA